MWKINRIFTSETNNIITDMAKIRGITDEMLTNPIADIHRYEFIIREGTQYDVAERLMKENYRIVYCNYWNDEDEKNGRQLTYSIDRKDITDRKGFSN